MRKGKSSVVLYLFTRMYARRVGVGMWMLIGLESLLAEAIRLPREWTFRTSVSLGTN